MRELSLQEIKEIELDILKTFHAFCAENDIKYYLSHGTLLGAIRYKKFIPWDDDIDVLVPREDYNRVLSLFKDSEQYRLFSFEKDKNYLYPYAKLCDMTTRKQESGYNNGIELGLDIDIFPLDAWDNDIDKAKKEVRAIGKDMMGLGLSKLKKPDSVNIIKRLVKGCIMIFCKILGSEFFLKRLTKRANKKFPADCSYLGCKAWSVYGEKDIIPAEVFAETIDVEFEGEKFPAPAGYDAYLTCLYGDYLPEPPKEKQKTHHAYKAYKL